MGKLYWNTWRRESTAGRDKFSHITVKVWDTNPNDTFGNCAIELSWQGDKHSSNKWYAFRGKVESSDPDDFTRAARVLRRIIPKDEYGYTESCSPQVIFDKLAKIGIRVIRDGRLSEWVKPEDVLSEDYHAWRDDWQQFSSRNGIGCLVGCVARSEREARKIITANMAEYLDTECSSGLYAKEWFNDGRPVKDISVDGYSSFEPPKVIDIEEMIKL